MKIGIFSKTYENCSLEETFKQMAQDGIYHTQFNFASAGLSPLPEAISPEILEEIKTLSKHYSINLNILTGTFNMIDPDIDARNRGILQFETQCKAAHELNIPIISLCTGSKHPESKWKWHDDNLKEESWNDLITTTKQIIKYAEKYNVILGVETEASNIIDTADKARKYLDEINSPYLKIIMDGANLFHPGQKQDMKDTLDYTFRLLGKDIVIAHAKDFSYDGNLKFVAAGEGELDFAYFIKLLNEYGYNGPIIMHGLSQQQIPSSKHFLEEILNEYN